MRIQSVQTNNNYNNKTSFGALILNKNMQMILDDLPIEELNAIRGIKEALKNTKYYDLHIQTGYIGNGLRRYVMPSFIPKFQKGSYLLGKPSLPSPTLLKDSSGYKTKLKWSDNDIKTQIVVLDFQSSDDAIKAKEIADNAAITIHTHDSPNRSRTAPQYIVSAIQSWADVCTKVLEKSMAFKESGKPKVLIESEKLIEDLLSTPKDGASQETIDTLRNYFKNNSDYGNLYTAEDMLELLRCMGEEDILYKKDILTTPIKEGDSSILMYVADIPRTEENAKKYDKILKILSRLQGINYNHKDEMGISFLEKVMMSENEKLLDLIKNERLEYYPELDYVYENIQNPNFKNKVKQLNIILKNTDGLSAKDIKSELQSIAFQNTVKSK